MIKRLLAIGLLYLTLSACVSNKMQIKETSESHFPEVQREFRAAWVATVANINWPSKPGLSVEEQKSEALSLLDLLKNNNFNAVIFQVRPQCDALYQSKLEPWSYFLTGEQGKAPEPLYDPLAFWIREAHNRGLELHAWLNPYRAHHIKGGEIKPTSIVKTKAHLALSLAQGYWWLDPSKKETQAHSLAVVMDLVKRYDLDGIHFDDYFYPYPSYNGGADFPDEESWNAYQKKGGRLSRGDWRRKGVNDFIKKVYTEIKKKKPHVKFGLSPFGIWRPGNPSSIAGFDQYDQLYADAKLWLNKGWIDYFTPQLYWPINQIPQSFPVLLGWWKSQNYKDRHLWPGVSIGRLKGKEAIDETINEIMITRGMLAESPGLVHWSIAPLVNSPELTKAIADGPYAKEALIPESKGRMAVPKIALDSKYLTRNDTVMYSWQNDKPHETKCYVVYQKYGDRWHHHIIGKDLHQYEVAKYIVDLDKLNSMALDEIESTEGLIIPLERLGISVVNRNGKESEVHEFDLPFEVKKAEIDLQEILKFRNIK